MENTDTIKLLQECDAGIKMAIASIDEVLEKICNVDMKQLLEESKKHHEKLKTDIHFLLESYRSEEKDPNPIAKGMSWMKHGL